MRMLGLHEEKLRKAMPKEATPKNFKAAIGFGYCNRLYSLERETDKFPGKQRSDGYREIVKPHYFIKIIW